MRITYGIQTEESNDIYLKAAEEAAESMIQAGIPGRFIVDFIPLCEYALSRQVQDSSHVIVLNIFQ